MNCRVLDSMLVIYEDNLLLMITFLFTEMISEFVESVHSAINQIDNRGNITVDFLFNFSEYFEKVDTNQISIKEIKVKFINQVEKRSVF